MESAHGKRTWRAHLHASQAPSPRDTGQDEESVLRDVEEGPNEPSVLQSAELRSDAGAARARDIRLGQCRN